MVAPARSRPVFTVGHSTRTVSEFAAMLQAAGVRMLVDVRRIPRSRTNPQYNLERLRQSLRRGRSAIATWPS